MIKAIIFDLGGVYFTDGTKQAARKIAKKFGLDEDVVAKSLTAKSEAGRLYRRGEISYQDFWTAICKSLDVEGSADDLNKLWLDIYKPIEGTVEVIKRLNKSGAKVYYLSDNVPERANHLQSKYSFLENFTDGIFSHKVHLSKIDGDLIFQKAVELVGQKASDLVYIDDKTEYVEEAENLGMKGIVFISPSQLEKDLHALGIKF